MGSLYYSCEFLECFLCGFGITECRYIAYVTADIYAKKDMSR